MAEYEVRLEKAKAVPIAIVRRRARREQLSVVVPEACGIVWSFVREQEISGAGRNVALFLDGAINMEVGVELRSPVPENENVFVSSTPAGSVATVTHRGAYDQLGRVHDAIRLWCQEHKKTLAGPNWEVYADWLPEWNNDLSLIQTDVFYLLA